MRPRKQAECKSAHVSGWAGSIEEAPGVLWSRNQSHWLQDPEEPWLLGLVDGEVVVGDVHFTTALLKGPCWQVLARAGPGSG